jgi:oxaloacetate decarboxylase
MLSPTEQRQRMRAILNGTQCLSPASVYDGLSARIAQDVGYTLGILAGSVSSNSTLAAPDLIVLTLTEFADQIRRIMRASDISLLVDADHGYGNALNVMRTVIECEHAGVSAMSIEDPSLPLRFGQTKDELISTEEMVGKLKAAVAARKDPTTVIAGRTAALKVEGVEGICARAKAYAACGVDCIFVVGAENIEQIKAVHQAAKLPIIAGSAPASITREQFLEAGVRVVLQGHQPLAAAVKVLREVYSHLYNGGAPAELKSKIASNEEMDKMTHNAQYKEWIKTYMK